MTEFLPCPHCGSDDIAPITFKGCNGDVWDEFIVCGGCGATAETVETWNMRAERTCCFIDDGIGEFPPKCSVCGYEPSIYECSWLGDDGYEFEGNYCPNCGCKAVGE